MAKDIVSMLEAKWEDGTRPADLYETYVARRPEEYVAAIAAGLGAKSKRVQSGCAEIASRLSADRPELLYPHLDAFLQNLRAKEPILRWEAVCTVGNLARVDKKKAVLRHLDRLIELLSDKSIVLQGHAVRALAKVATSNPTLAPRILSALLDAARFFPGSRVGYIVEATESFAEHVELRSAIRAFLAPHVESEQSAVARKAKKVLKRIGE